MQMKIAKCSTNSSMRTAQALLETFPILQTLSHHSENNYLSQHLGMSTVKVASKITIYLTLFSVLAKENTYEQVSCYALAVCEERIRSHLCSQKYSQR